MEIQFKSINDKMKIPMRANKGDAGYDVVIAGFSKITRVKGERKLVPLNKDRYTITSGNRIAVNTGICVALPEGTYLTATIRSGRAMWDGLYIPNAPCTIDEGYRGEIIIIVANGGSNPVSLNIGERIAQFILKRYETIEWKETNTLPPSQRGEGGFGSSGD